MEQWLGGVGARGVGWLVVAVPMATGLAQGCGGGGDQPTTPAPGGGIFGGSGGVTQVLPATPSASAAPGLGGGGGGGGGNANGCQNTPPGMLALIDDFDDGDSVAAFEPEREAYWFTINDGSAGTIEPTAEFLPVPNGYRGTRSAHVTASDYSVWGAALMANISHKTELRCPYDASGFRGLRFVARGQGRVRVVVQMPGVISTEYGGTCNAQAGQVCYDTHGLFVELGAEYQTFELPWSRFLQRGFGLQVPFDPKTVSALQFVMESADLPVDLWVDQVEFWDGSTPADGGTGAGGAGGTGGASGSTGEAGSEAEAGAATGGAGAHG